VKGLSLEIESAVFVRKIQAPDGRGMKRANASESSPSPPLEERAGERRSCLPGSAGILAGVAVLAGRMPALPAREGRM